MQRRFLGEKQIRPIQRQIAVHLVGRYLVEAPHTVFTATFHQHLRAHHIGAHKDAGVGDGAVHVAFSGKVDHDVRLFLLKEAVDRLRIGDIRANEAKARIVHDGSKGFQIAGIGQLVQTDDTVLRVMSEQVKNKVGADKACSAGNDDVHDASLL